MLASLDYGGALENETEAVTNLNHFKILRK